MRRKIWRVIVSLPVLCYEFKTQALDALDIVLEANLNALCAQRWTALACSTQPTLASNGASHHPIQSLSFTDSIGLAYWLDSFMVQRSFSRRLLLVRSAKTNIILSLHLPEWHNQTWSNSTLSGLLTLSLVWNRCLRLGAVEARKGKLACCGISVRRTAPFRWGCWELYPCAMYCLRPPRLGLSGMSWKSFCPSMSLQYAILVSRLK